TFDGRKTAPGIALGQGPYLYSYAMNTAMGTNFKPYGAYQTTKITQWHAPWKKILLTERMESTNMEPSWDWASPIALRHGTIKFHGNVPGNSQLLQGATVGRNVSTVFLDGHAEGIDQDF